MSKQKPVLCPLCGKTQEMISLDVLREELRPKLDALAEHNRLVRALEWLTNVAADCSRYDGGPVSPSESIAAQKEARAALKKVKNND